jgi:cell division protein FtsX
MQFIELLSLMAGGTVFFAAFMEGKKAGVLGTSIGLVLGLALGFGVFWGTRVTLKRAIQRLNLQEPKPPPLRLALSWFICLAVFVGMVAAGIFASWFTRLVIHAIQ